MSVWNPRVRGPFQYSSVAILVEATFGTDFEQVQLGWTVSVKGREMNLKIIVRLIFKIFLKFFFFFFFVFFFCFFFLILKNQ